MERHDMYEVAFDPATREAIINIQIAIKRIALVCEKRGASWESTQSEELAEAQAELEQAVRWLLGEEEPG